MGLMDVKSILKMADENRFAAAAIDVFDYQSAHWVVEAAERENMPVLLMFYPDMSWFIPFSTMAAIALDLARQAKVPVGVHLDHGKSYEIAVGGIAAGFPSIMYDGSARPFEENLSVTASVVKCAHLLGVDVEAELGTVGQGSRKEDFCNEEFYTKPEMARDFVAGTGVDSLAVAIGNSHGHYVCEPHLDIRRLDEINKTIDTPLVLHGGSGIPAEQMIESVKYGINKVNIGTEFFEKCKNCIAAHMGEDGFVLDHYKEAGEEVIDFVRGRIARINPYHFSL